MKKFFVIIIAMLSFLMIGNCASADEGGYIVKVREGSFNLFSLADNTGTELAENSDLYYVSNETELKQFLKTHDVEFYEPDITVTLFDTPSDPIYADMFNLPMIKAEAARNIYAYGSGIRVGVIDSGIIQHEDLKNNILPGHNYAVPTSDPAAMTDVTDTVKNKEGSIVGHGTLASGVIAAEMNDIGCLGVSPKVKIVPLKCFTGKDTTSIAYIISAIYGGVDDFKCDVLNMSFGADGMSEAFENAINYAVSKGVLIVASVGNNGTTALNYPAAFNNVVGVGSVDANLKVSSFSQHNSSVYICAPGENIITTGASSISSYMYATGTSFSAPQVSAAAAIAKSIKNDITQAEFMEALKNSATDLGDAGCDNYYGYGLLNIEGMINEVFKLTDGWMSEEQISYEKQKMSMYIHNSKNAPINIIVSSDKDDSFEKANIIPIPANSGNIYNFDFSKKPSGNYLFKFMLWDDFENIRPLAKMKSIDMYIG